MGSPRRLSKKSKAKGNTDKPRTRVMKQDKLEMDTLGNINEEEEVFLTEKKQKPRKRSNAMMSLNRVQRKVTTSDNENQRNKADEIPDSKKVSSLSDIS